MTKELGFAFLRHLSFVIRASFDIRHSTFVIPYDGLIMEPTRSLILAYVLIVVGLFLLVAELFMPSGTFLVLSLTAIVIGVAMTFIYSDDPPRGIVDLICVFAAVPLVGGLILHY